jgi:DNA-binding GntR family transcriptional regulator
MEEKKTLSKYLYDELAGQIKSGKLIYGERIPSYIKLCDIYNVGIRTVRDVIKKLSADGYLRTVARSHVEVAYKEGEGGGSTAGIKTILAKGEAVTDLLKTMEYLLPYIYTQASKLVDENIIKKCRRGIEGIDKQDMNNKLRISSVTRQSVISVFGNLLLRDLYIDVGLFAQVPIIESFDPFADNNLIVEKGLSNFLDKVQYRDFAGIYGFIVSIYGSTAQLMKEYFDAVAEKYSGMEIAPVFFNWNAEKGRMHLYTSIARDLIEKIGNGVYPDGTPLPGSSQMEREYGASMFTLNKALDALADVGLIHKKSQRGRYLVTVEKARSVFGEIRQEAYARDMLNVMEAIHATALMCRGFAYAGFDHISAGAADELEAALDEPPVMTVTVPNNILRYIIRNQPLRSLENIFCRLEEFMNWGFYFDFVRNNVHYRQTVLKRAKIAVSYIRTGKKEEFANMIQDIYYTIFYETQKALADLGVKEAEHIKLP